MTDVKLNEAVTTYISGLTTAAGIQGFANAVLAAIKGADPAIAADATATAAANGKVEFDSPAEGYWLIVDTAETNKTLVMLDTTDINIQSKTTNVEVEKSADKEDWFAIGSEDIDKTITYTLTATLPKYLKDYTDYQLIFTDTLPADRGRLPSIGILCKPHAGKECAPT